MKVCLRHPILLCKGKFVRVILTRLLITQLRRRPHVLLSCQLFMSSDFSNFLAHYSHCMCSICFSYFILTKHFEKLCLCFYEFTSSTQNIFGNFPWSACHLGQLTKASFHLLSNHFKCYKKEFNALSARWLARKKAVDFFVDKASTFLLQMMLPVGAKETKIRFFFIESSVTFY